MNSGLNAESAVKLLRPLPSQKSEDGGPIDKDGFDGSSEVQHFIIEVGLNGFFVIISYEDSSIPDMRYVCQTMDEAIQIIRDHF